MSLGQDIKNDKYLAAVPKWDYHLSYANNLNHHYKSVLGS